jgi:predicted glycosyl hydrolase (DUF1957 family)
MMIYLGFLLHIYQPPNQLDKVLSQIGDECYRPLLRLINDREDARFTVNINWSLTELLRKKDHGDIIESVRQALKSSRIEVTGTGAYHPILPLIPSAERARQILLNAEKNRLAYGHAFKPVGLFPPEMAFGHEIVNTVKELGYRWIITEDIPFTAIHHDVPYNYIATMDDLPVFLRSSFWSNRISLERDEDGKPFTGERIAPWLIHDVNTWFDGRDGYLILAMDGETFGHHHKGHIERFLIPFLDHLASMPDEIRLVHITDLLERFPRKEKEIPPGSWSTSVEDFWEGNFFPLWKNRYNRAHQLLWELTQIALDSVTHLHEQLDKSLNSCTFWWAAVHPREFSPITYSGMEMLINIIRKANPAALQEAMKIRRLLEKAFNERYQ